MTLHESAWIGRTNSALIYYISDRSDHRRAIALLRHLYRLNA